MYQCYYPWEEGDNVEVFRMKPEITMTPSKWEQSNYRDYFCQILLITLYLCIYDTSIQRDTNLFLLFFLGIWESHCNSNFQVECGIRRLIELKIVPFSFWLSIIKVSFFIWSSPVVIHKRRSYCCCNRKKIVNTISLLSGK